MKVFYTLFEEKKNKMIDLIMNILPIILFIHVKSLPGHIQNTKINMAFWPYGMIHIWYVGIFIALQKTVCIKRKLVMMF